MGQGEQSEPLLPQQQQKDNQNILNNPPSYGTTPYTVSAPPPAFMPSYTSTTNQRFANIPPELVEDVRGVQSALTTLGITPKHRAKVCLVLDISRSMQNPNQFFHDMNNDCKGPIFSLIKKALATAMVFDNDQELEIFTFGRTAQLAAKANDKNFEQIIDEILGENPAQILQDRTNYAAAMRSVRQYYFQDDSTINKKASAEEPVFMIFVTDGEHNMEENYAAGQFRASSYQPIFCKIIALEGQGNPNFEFLQKLDDAPTLDQPNGQNKEKCNLTDNADFVRVKNPPELTIELLLKEYPQWVAQAETPQHGHTLLTEDQGINAKIVAQGAKAAGRIGESSKNGCCRII